jgi:uncharacterized protein YbjT (DUF2867 family)
MYLLSAILLASCSVYDALAPNGRRIPVVAVAGSTGQVGRLVVAELVNANYTVRALTRDISKAKSMLAASDNVEIVKCDLSDASQVNRALKDCESCIWCASGLTQNASWLQKIISLTTLKLTPTKTLEIEGIRLVGNAMKAKKDSVQDGCPKLILCSSAGVTRPEWPEEKKKRLVGAADIPIVRLNPFNILGLKKQGEDVIRNLGVPYSIVRPCGLNNEWPKGRQILSQGDVAVGKTNRINLARLLVKLLEEPMATSKTFESFTLANYPEPRSYSDQLSRLVPDGTVIDESVLSAEYALLQQLLPGETLAPQNLAMGQTYEQLDKGEQGRLGVRGSEKVPLQAV